MTINYPKAPIQEALIEVWPKLENPIPLEALSEIVSRLPKEYKKKENIIKKHIQYDFGKKDEEQAIQTDQEQVGFLLKTTDEKYIAQITKNFFTINRIEPYISGDDLVSHFHEIWDVYTKEIKIKEFLKIGLRFINVFEIPLNRDSENFVKIPIHIFGSEEFVYSESEKSVKFESKQFKAFGDVKFKIKAAEKKAKCIFDISTFKINLTLKNFSEFEKHYKTLRELKNEIFELNLTDHLKDTFKNE